MVCCLADKRNWPTVFYGEELLTTVSLGMSNNGQKLRPMINTSYLVGRRLRMKVGWCIGIHELDSVNDKPVVESEY